MEDILEWKRQGLSVSDISTLTGFDRKTVRKYLSAAPAPRYPKRNARPSILSGFEEYIKERLSAGVWNAVVLFGELKERGYQGGYTAVKSHLQPLRAEARNVAVRRFETPSGKQAQVDWAELGRAPQSEGATTKFYALVVTLGHSRAMFAEVATGQKLGTLMRLLEQAFHYLGGVPQELLFDNMKTVVLKHLTQGTDARGEIVWNPAFFEFSRYWGFTPRLCRPRRPQTKGKVESSVGYIVKNFLCGRVVSDEQDASRQLAAWVAEVANKRVHGTTHRIVEEAWREERPYLQPTGSRPPYPFVEQLERVVARDAFVAFRTNRYPVPWQAAGKSVYVRLVSDTVHIAGEDGLLVSHPLCQGKYQTLPAGDLHRGIPCDQAASGSKNRLVVRSGTPEVEQRSLSVYEECVA